MNREFSIQSMLLHAKLHKRSLMLILAVSVLLSLLAGLVFAPKAADPTVNEAYQTELKQYEIDQQMLEQTVRYYRDSIDGINDYFANSLLIEHNLLSQEAYQIQAQIITQSSDAEMIGSSYVGFSKEKDFIDQLSQLAALNADKSYIAELVEVYFDKDSQTIFINARHPDAVKKQQMAALTLEYISTRAKENIPEAHRVIVSDVGPIKALQSPLNLKINELVKQRDDAKTQLELREKALESLVPPSEVEASMDQTPLLKFLVLGILLGLALMIIYLVYKSYAKDARVLIGDLKEYYGLPVLFGLAGKQSLLEKNATLYLDEAKAGEHFENLLSVLAQDKILVVGKSPVLERTESKKVAFIDRLDAAQTAVLKQADGVILALDPYSMTHSELQQVLSIIRLSATPLLGVIIQ